jgi:hypothetical protein
MVAGERKSRALRYLHARLTVFTEVPEQTGRPGPRSIMTGARVGSEEDDQMERETDYCRRKAAEYERRAQEAADKDIRTFLCRMRDNWVEAAKDFERGGGVKRTTVKPGLKFEAIFMGSNASISARRKRTSRLPSLET